MKKFIILLLIILFFTKTQNVFSATRAFTVDNIEIMGKTNAQNYRNKYLQVAFKKGFEKLIISIIREKDQKELLSTNAQIIKTFILSYKIIEEKIIDNDYKLKVAVVFNRKLVEKFLQEKNISYSEEKKLDMLVYPILILDSNLHVFSKNKFFEEWNRHEDSQNISFILPIENLDDIDFIKKNLLTLEESNLSRLVDNYEIKNSTIVILRYDKKQLNAFLKINLSGINKVKKIDFVLENYENAEARGDIILNLKNYINEVWKEENLIDISTPSYLTVNTKITDMTSIKKIIDKIKGISLIETYSVEKIDNESAKIKIKFFGKIKNLQERFRENGFRFEILHNEWNLYLKT